jgi:hypothetical protein
MPSTRALSVTLLVCVVIAVAFAFTLIATIAEGVALLALLGLAARRVHQMNRWTSILLVTGIALLPLGWALVFASGYGGNSTGGSEVVWRIGGLMVYAAFAMLLLAAVIHAARRVGAAIRGRRPAAR